MVLDCKVEQIIIPAGHRYAVLCDIDGTIANINHRRHLVGDARDANGNRTWPTNDPNFRKNWKKFFDEAPKDTPIWPVITTFHALQDSANLAGVLVTGRHESFRKPTEKWLAQWRIQYDRLYMREHDGRPDRDEKVLLLAKLRADGYHPYISLDDRDSVVDMWREQGILTLQCARGDF